jgi:hypothetical protein
MSQDEMTYQQPLPGQSTSQAVLKELSTVLNHLTRVYRSAVQSGSWLTKSGSASSAFSGSVDISVPGSSNLHPPLTSMLSQPPLLHSSLVPVLIVHAMPVVHQIIGLASVLPTRMPITHRSSDLSQTRAPTPDPTLAKALNPATTLVHRLETLHVVEPMTVPTHHTKPVATLETTNQWHLSRRRTT